MKKLSDCRILVVDDAKINLDILVEGLKEDYQLSLALNGEMALKIAEQIPPDLVLLDIEMPGLNGFEVCRRLRSNPATAETPVMFLSSRDEVESKAEGFEAGGNDYLTKPFEMIEVKARVRSMLKAKAYNDAVKEQLAAELRVAREIQMGMLPRDFSPFESPYGISFGAVLEPAREVGGDLYGVCAAGMDRLVTFLGDVSGKGIPASLFMIRAVSLAKLLARDVADPQKILARLNDELSSENPSGMFVTFVCSIYEPSTRRLILANAGHCYPLLIRKNAPPELIRKFLGTALGFEPEMRFESIEIRLEPGDAVAFYTDGVIEAFNSEDELYGADRLLEDAALLAGLSPQEVCSGILTKVRDFAGVVPQSDDIAILSIRVNDTLAVSRPHASVP